MQFIHRERMRHKERENEYGSLVMSDFVRFVGHVSRKHEKKT